MMTATITIQDLRQHQLVILRRLRAHPLTEFDLASEVVGHSGWTSEQAAENMEAWLIELCDMGLVWVGTLCNSAKQNMVVAALTKAGREIVNG